MTRKLVGQAGAFINDNFSESWDMRVYEVSKKHRIVNSTDTEKPRVAIATI